MVNEALKNSVMEDVVALQHAGWQPVLSHGGGPGINKMLEQLNIPVKFIGGLRYTDEATMKVVESVLIGQVGTELTGLLQKKGGKACAISGVSGNLYHCRQKSEELGLVGEIDEIDTAAVDALLDAGLIPVVAPVGTDGQGHTFNINGDTAGSILAAALEADKLVLLTDIEGLCNSIEERDVISYLNIKDVPALKEKGVISGGMLPKIDGCVQAIENGVGSVHIIDGRVPHSLLSLLDGETIGTTIGTEHESIGIK
ncbi:MAG: acetylglutamate kinase [Lachnospiraceae bacterium]|nr:acetylglutamate kinase [Lachnospiraceae bacterium]